MIDCNALTLATQTRLWLNMKPVTFDTQSGSVVTALFNGGSLRIGNNTFENQDMNGRIGPWHVGTRANGLLLPPDRVRRGLMLSKCPKDLRLNLVMKGNSIMAGQGATISPPAAFKTLATAAGFTARDVHDRGKSGLKVIDAINDWKSTDIGFVDGVYDRNAYAFFEVRNSSQAGESSTTIINQHLELARLVRGQGMQFIVGTAPPSDGDAFGQNTPGAVNAFIRSNWRTFADGFFDLEIDPRFTPAGSVLNPTMYLDGVHLTDAGNAIVGQKIFSAIIT